MAKVPKTAAKDGAIDSDAVRMLARLLDETGLTEIEYGRDGWHVRVAKGVQAPAPTGAVPTAAADREAADLDDVAGHPGLVTSPMVGVVFMSPEPGAPPFVRVGDQVGVGDTLLLIEAMKVFNPIEAPSAGKVTRVMVTDGTPVEYGEPMLVIE